MGRKFKMAVLKYKDIERLNKQEKEDKLKELKLELVKKNVTANKAGKIKTKEIKKAIARLLTSLASKPKNTQK